MTVLIVVLLSFLQLPLGHEALSVMWNWTRSEKDNCKAVWSTGAYKSRELRMNGQDPFLQYSGFDQKGNMKMKDVLLIHVGKTGGTSVSWSMRANKIAITEIHVHPVLPKMMQRHKYVFVTIRDPIERFISAFNFNHPLGTHPKNSDVYSCYSNVSAAAAAILDLGECSRLMRGASDQLDLHTEMGYCYYLGGIRSALKSHKNIFVLETNTCVDDTMHILRKLGYTLHHHFQSQSLHVFNNISQHEILSNKLSDEANATLRKFLTLNGEYGLYNDLLQLARGLNISRIRPL